MQRAREAPARDGAPRARIETRQLVDLSRMLSHGNGIGKVERATRRVAVGRGFLEVAHDPAAAEQDARGGRAVPAPKRLGAASISSVLSGRRRTR